MKIVFVCDTMGAGGAERVISTLSNELTSFSHDVVIIIASHDSKESYYRLNNNIKLIPLLEGLIKRPRFFKRAKLLRKAIEQEKPDVVVSFLSHICIYTWVALKNTKIPFIVSERNDPNQWDFVKKLLLKLTYNRASACIFQTEDAMRWYGKKVESKSTIIYNPANLTYHPSGFDGKRKKVILAVGRIWEQKNYFFLVDAFKTFNIKHPEYILKIYGDGPLKEKLGEYIYTNGLSDSVKLLPSSKTWHKDEYDAKVFVLGSKYEGMPNVLEEALCLGIPSVSTDCPIGGPKELKKVFPDLLLLAKPHDVNDFVNKMEECLNIQNRECSVPDCLSIEYISNEWIKVFEKVIKK